MAKYELHDTWFPLQTLKKTYNDNDMKIKKILVFKYFAWSHKVKKVILQKSEDRFIAWWKIILTKMI